MTHPIPTICDLCRTRGTAGDAPFAEIADLLDFTPVPVRAHANNWTEQHQRAFIAALATTGNVRPAARAIGRYPTGAERLRKSPRGKSFAQAWDNALDLYRERELALLQDSLTELDAAHREAMASSQHIAAEMDYYRAVDDPGGEPDAQDVAEAHARIAARLWAARRICMAEIACDPAKRAAWDLLCGPVDWQAAAEGRSDAREVAALERCSPPNPKDPAMVIAGMHGLLPVQPAPEGGAEEAAEEMAMHREPWELSCDDIADASAEELRAKGWTMDRHGNWWAPK